MGIPSTTGANRDGLGTGQSGDGSGMPFDMPELRNGNGWGSKLSRSNYKDGVARVIREDIFSGRLRPGERVNQDKLGERFGVSRLPIREALILLTAEGLLDTIPHRGTFVHWITPEDICDHFEIFGLVAGLAVARAAERMTDENLDAVRVAYETARKYAHDSSARERTDFQFHRLINRTGSSQAVRSQLRILAKTIPGKVFTAEQWQIMAEHDHRNLLDAIERRDGAAAAQAMRSHLKRAGEFVVEAMEQVGFWEPVADRNGDIAGPDEIVAATALAGVSGPGGTE